MAPVTLAPAWQHPHVNVFKLCGLDDGMKEFERAGDVTDHMDRVIGKKVFKVRGTIPATNFLRVPKTKSQPLGLTGRFLYMQIKVSPVKVFVIHVEVQTADQNVHRISISSMYKDGTLRRKSSGIQIPFPGASHRWCIVALDLAGSLSSFTTSPMHSVKSIQLCSWLTVRSMFTSDLKFSLKTLPGDMALSHALDSSLFQFVWLPVEPTDVKESEMLPMQRKVAGMKKGERGMRVSSTPSIASLSSLNSPRGEGTIPPPQSPTQVAPPLPPYWGASGNLQDISTAALTLAGDIAKQAVVKLEPQGIQATVPAFMAAAKPEPAGPVAAAAAGRLPLQPVECNRAVADQAVTQIHGAMLEPDPAITLTRINAYTGEFVRTVVWPPHSNEVVFTAGSVIVAMQAHVNDPVVGSGLLGNAAPTQPGPPPAQRFFMGHTGHVVALAFDAEGAVMASAQEGKHAVVRVWDFKTGQCVAILNGHASGMTAVDVSRDARAVVGVGLDSANRQLIVLWDISALRLAGRPEVVVRQTTEHNIKAIKFSAYEEDHLVTAGRDNVRFYRLKNGQLRGVTARLGAPDKRVSGYMGGLSAALGPNVFTDIGFESSVGVYAPEERHVFVSSASGAVFEIDYGTRSLLCVYQLHSAAINSLVVHDGFVVTGSDDKLLRVWPMDFSDFLMEAEHEAGVTSVGVSPDGLRVAIGTESGALGVLDVPTHAYTTLLRSHTGTVNAVVVDPVRDQYCTVSSDGTIRIWDLHTHAQLVEFDAPSENALCAAYHPRHYELAVGFENGRTRVFDIATTTLVQEHMQHKAAVVQISYSSDGVRLYTGGADGGLCVYDVAQVYLPTKFLAAGVRDLKVCLAVSDDGRYIATVSRDPYRSITSLIIFHGTTLDPYMRIETDTPVFKRIAFSPDCMELWAVAEPNRLDRYELFEGQLLQQVSCAHRLDIHALAVDPGGRFVVTAGNDALVKLWAVAPRDQPRKALQLSVPAHQAFSGHSSAVFGAAVKGQYLITVGDAESVYVWRINTPERPTSQPAPGQGVLPGVSPLLPAASAQPTPRSSQWQAAEPASSMHAQNAAAGVKMGRPSTASRVVGPPSAAPAPPGRPATTGSSGRKGVEVGDGMSVLPTVSPGPSQVVTATSVEFPAPRPIAEALVGYTPSGTAQNAVWVAGLGLIVYAVDNVVVVEDLATHAQRFLTHLTRPVSTLAVSPDSRLVAAAPAAAEPSAFAEVVVWDLDSGERVAALQYHPVSVEALAFSPDSRVLVSVGRDPERSVVVWDIATLSPLPVTATLAQQRQPRPPPSILAVGRTRFAVVAAAWLPLADSAPVEATREGSGQAGEEGAAKYKFVTAGGDGLLLWALRPDCLEQMPIILGGGGGASVGSGHGPGAAAVPATAVTVDGQGLIVVADAQGIVWEVAVKGDGRGVAMRRVADVPGNEVSRIAVNDVAAAVGTLGGLVAVYSRGGGGGAVWESGSELHVDGAVSCLCFEPSMVEAVVATTSSTIWYANAREGWRVPLVASHTAPLTSLSAPGRAATQVGTPSLPLLASTSSDGVLRAWRMDTQSEPIAEFQTGVPCTCAAFVGASMLRPGASQPPSPRPGAPTARDPVSPEAAAIGAGIGPGLAIVGGYADGSMRLFGERAGEVALRWTSQRHKAPVVSLVAHPRGNLILSASSDGGLAVTEIGSSRLSVFLEHFVQGSQQQLLQMPDLDISTVVASGISAQARGPAPAVANPLCCVDVSPVDATVCAAAWRTHMVVFATPWDDSVVRMMAMYRCEDSAGSLSVDVPAIVQFVPHTTKVVAYSSPLLLGKVLLFDYRLAAVVRSINVTQMVRSLALSPDGATAALGGMGGAVFVAETGVGDEGKAGKGGVDALGPPTARWVELKGHLHPVTAVRFVAGAPGEVVRLVSGSGTCMWQWRGVEVLLQPTPVEVRESKVLWPY